MRRKRDIELALRGAPRGWADIIRRVVEAALEFRSTGGSRSRARAVAEAHCLSIAFVSDVEMARVNQRWLRHKGPTDVITFDLREDPDSPSMNGELVISLDTARREARLRRHAPRDEAMLYVVHGTLHLLGHDDATASGAAEMHRIEDSVLASCGLTPAFRH